MTYSMIYVTCADKSEAERIAKTLLEKRLIACANIMAPHTAIYMWEDKPAQDEEVAMLLKTRTELFEEIRDDICALHSYDCPCIVSWPIETGHKPFLDWIGQETQGGKQK